MGQRGKGEGVAQKQDCPEGGQSMQRNVAYVFLYKNGIKERSVGIVKRYGTAKQPEVALELFGEEARKEWNICYLTKGEALCEAIYLWEIAGAYGRNETRHSRCRLCAEAGMGAGVVLLPEKAESRITNGGSVGQGKLSEFTRSDLREYLCARYDGKEMTEEMLWTALGRSPEQEETENLCLESAKKLMEEITRVAGGESTEVKVKQRPRKQMTYLEELLFLKPPYLPCRRYDVEYSVRIVPEDLLYLPKEGKRYAENSFVLHSFYRYRHILLGRRRKKEKEDHVLLLPGVYNEKEACLAKMFGFSEFFPVAVKKSETDSAVSGKEIFGYFCGKI